MSIHPKKEREMPTLTIPLHRHYTKQAISFASLSP